MKNLTLSWKFWTFLLAVALLPALAGSYSIADWIMVGIAATGLAFSLVWWFTAFSPRKLR